MQILYLSQYFPPEMGAPAARVSELAVRWQRNGQEVCVLTALPHHPTGVVPPAYRGKLLVRERYQGVSVVRAYVYATPNKGVVKRALSYLSFAISSVLTGLFARDTRRCDVLIATSPQFLCAVSGYLLSRLKRVPFVLEIRDLWPQSIVEVGAMPEGHPVIRILRHLERFLYRSADLLIGVTDSFRETWIAQGIDPGKIHIVKNGVDLERFRPAPRENEIRAEYGLSGKFVVSYIGTHGMAHGLEVLIETAEALRSDPGIVFLFVGEGARREALVEMAKERGLENVIFAGEQPRDRIPAFVAASDLCAVLLRPTELFKQVIPSKIFEIMGCARPILLGVAGEAASIVEAADCGYVVPPGEKEAIVAAIEAARNDPQGCEERGRNGRRYAIEHFDRDLLAARYERLLDALLRSKVESILRREA